MKQIQEYLSDNNLHSPLQSAYRQFHSVETALVRVQNDVLLALDQRKEALLVLLDFSSAFDTIDHGILIDRLKHRFGLDGVVLKWLTSYLFERSHVVKVRGALSNPVVTGCGVPQGSVIGPLLYTLYSAPIADIVSSHGLSSMLYADDTQIYVTYSAGDQQAAILKINNCLRDIVSWACVNKLKINADKTELIHFSSRFRTSIIPASAEINGLNISEKATARNLGVHMDHHLLLKDHLKITCRSAMSAIRKIGQIRNFLDKKTTEKLIHAFVSSRIDWCNALLFGLPEKDIKKLQIVQNSAARLVERAKGRDPVTPMLRRLHWLPVQERIVYKILMLCHKVITHKSPTYLFDIISSYLPVRSLRSSNKNYLTLPTTSTHTYGSRAFSSAAPVLWNKLPDHLRGVGGTDSFGRALKTYLFSKI